MARPKKAYMIMHTYIHTVLHLSTLKQAIIVTHFWSFVNGHPVVKVIIVYLVVLLIKIIKLAYIAIIHGFSIKIKL